MAGPGPQALHGGLREQEQVAGLEDGLPDEAHLVVAIRKISRGFDVAFVTGLDDDESPVVLFHILQHPDRLERLAGSAPILDVIGA